LLHQTKQKSATMKTSTITLTAILALNISLLFAGNDCTLPPASPVKGVSTTINICPTTPKEASFGDTYETLDLSLVAPVTPQEADFNDPAPEGTNDTLARLAPVTPKVAAFDDNL
jgi:hypothetical protein